MNNNDSAISDVKILGTFPTKGALNENTLEATVQELQISGTYLRISAYSYPALAVYNAGAALFRSIGKTSVTMYLSVI